MRHGESDDFARAGLLENFFSLRSKSRRWSEISSIRIIFLPFIASAFFMANEPIIFFNLARRSLIRAWCSVFFGLIKILFARAKTSPRFGTPLLGKERGRG